MDLARRRAFGNVDWEMSDHGDHSFLRGLRIALLLSVPIWAVIIAAVRWIA